MAQREPQQAVWHHLTLSWCTMVSEVKSSRRARKQNIDYAKQHHTRHNWLPAKVMHPENPTKRLSWLADAIFIVEWTFKYI